MTVGARRGAVAAVVAIALGSADASLASWPDEGVVLCVNCRVAELLPSPDGSGGAVVLWANFRNPDFAERWTHAIRDH